MKELIQIVEPLLEWFEKEKRDLPWRHTKDSYKIWISEIMLQQTRVEAVKVYYERFLKELPTLQDLANTSEDKLLKLWEGLGYYSRARNLKKCAEHLVKNKLSELPRNYEELKSLPGIGPYAAASIGSIAYNQKTPAIDGNVLRVMTRIYEDNRDISKNIVRNEYFEKLKEIMPNNTRDFTESLMELGALICLPNGSPLCEKCPISFLCQSYQHNTMLQYPNKVKKIKRKIEEKTIFILEYKNTFAIRKRNEKGLLALMYEFYHIEGLRTEVEIKEKLKKEEMEFETIHPLGTSKHIFSHIEWHMTGYYIKCTKKPRIELIWVTKEELMNDYSLPNAFSFYAKQIKL